MVARSAIGLASAACRLLAAQFVVRKVVRLAKYYGLSETVLGLTVVSLGTSLPEIASHVVVSGQILLGVAARFDAVEKRHLGRPGAALLVLLYFLYLFVRLTHFRQDFPADAVGTAVPT